MPTCIVFERTGMLQGLGLLTVAEITTDPFPVFVTIPDELIVAMAVLELDQDTVPPHGKAETV